MAGKKTNKKAGKVVVPGSDRKTERIGPYVLTQYEDLMVGIASVPGQRGVERYMPKNTAGNIPVHEILIEYFGGPDLARRTARWLAGAGQAKPLRHPSSILSRRGHCRTSAARCSA